MKKLPYYLFFAGILFTAGAQKALAQNTPSCIPVYGGGSTCTASAQLSITKQVEDPQTGQYTNAAPIYNATFFQGQTIPFKITVTNLSSSAITGITVTDQFPDNVSFLSGSGTFTPSTNVFTTSIQSLPANASTVIYLTGKAGNIFPANSDTVCTANQATATAGSMSASANSQFCLSRSTSASAAASPSSSPPMQTSSAGGLPVYPPSKNGTTTPATGPNDWAIAGLLPAGIAGLLLRRKKLIQNNTP
jgi:uncharacterized repeat protein (TIGR01451 family)